MRKLTTYLTALAVAGFGFTAFAQDPEEPEKLNPAPNQQAGALAAASPA